MPLHIRVGMVMVFVRVEQAVLVTVSEIYAETDYQPHKEPYPGYGGKPGHQENARGHPQQRDHRAERRFERPGPGRLFNPQYYHPETHKHESE